jgi:hypothetical protein
VHQSFSRGGQTGIFGATTPMFPRGDSAAAKNIAFNLQGIHGKGTIENSSTSGRVSAIDNISRGVPGSVHPKSSETAYKILQHLEKPFLYNKATRDKTHFSKEECFSHYHQ